MAEFNPKANKVFKQNVDTPTGRPDPLYPSHLKQVIHNLYVIIAILAILLGLNVAQLIMGA